MADEGNRSDLHIRLGKSYNAAPSKNALCGIAVSSYPGGWPDMSVGVVTCNTDGPWTVDQLSEHSDRHSFRKVCEGCLKQSKVAIPLLSLKGGQGE
jgi:hypothetical protein